MQNALGMSSGEFAFVEPFLEKTCFVCAKKGKFRRYKGKHLICECHTVFVPMRDGRLLVFQHAPTQPNSPSGVIVPA